MSYPDYSYGDIGSMVNQRNKGHVRVHNAGRKTGSDTLNFKSEGVNLSFRDSWRGHGPFAEMTRSVLLENNLGSRQGVVHYNEKLFTENSQNAYPEGITRLVTPLSPTDPGIRRLQLAILLQHHPNQIEQVADMDIENQLQPVTLIGPGVWQAHVIKAQLNIWKAAPEKYRRLAPTDVFRGWKIDGIVDRDDMPLGLLLERVRELTVVTRNKVAVRSYWRNARCGSYVGIVVKKFPTSTLHKLREEDDDEATGTGGVLQRVPLTPFTIGFWSTRYGEEPSSAIREYVDDDGFTRSDGLVFQIGTVASVPRGNFGVGMDVEEHETCEAFHADLEQQVIDQYTPMDIYVDIKIK